MDSISSYFQLLGSRERRRISLIKSTLHLPFIVDLFHDFTFILFFTHVKSLLCGEVNVNVELLTSSCC